MLVVLYFWLPKVTMDMYPVDLLPQEACLLTNSTPTSLSYPKTAPTVGMVQGPGLWGIHSDMNQEMRKSREALVLNQLTPAPLRQMPCWSKILTLKGRGVLDWMFLKMLLWQSFTWRMLRVAEQVFLH